MSAQSLHASAVDALSNWDTDSDDAESLRHTMLAFLDSAPDGCLRSHAPGHITASSLVLDEDGSHVLLTLHPRVGRWIQLGGRCERHARSRGSRGSGSIRGCCRRTRTPSRARWVFRRATWTCGSWSGRPG